MTTITIHIDKKENAELLEKMLRELSFIEEIEVSDDDNKVSEPQGSYVKLKKSLEQIEGKSVFNGAADKDAYEEITHISEQLTHKLVYDDATKRLHSLYQQVRDIREAGEGTEKLTDIFNELKTKFRHDWLAALQILEILHHTASNPALEKEVRIYLEMKAANEKEFTKLINDGFHVIANPVTQLIAVED